MVIKEIKGIGKAPKKAPYKKPASIRELENLAMAEARQKHPTFPYLAPRTFRDDTANALTKCVVEYIRLSGGFASRISNQGTYSRRMGRYIPSTARKGLADVMGTYCGKSLSVEIKVGKDRQSEHQRKVEEEIVAARGHYFIATNFGDFKDWFDDLKANCHE